jgi:hypothetical protein
MLKYLRIAVTALCLTACALLVALWVRSYWQSIDVDLPISSGAGVGLQITNGTIAAQFGDSQQYRLLGLLINDLEVEFNSPPLLKLGDFRWGERYVRAPFWFITLAVSTVACVPWIQWSKRFSLRTLLIATTLVAVGLGLVVALS